MPRGTQAMMPLVGLLLLLLAVGGGCEDTVAASVGRHTISRIADLLSRSECRRLRRQLEVPNKGLLGEQQLKQLSEENNPILSPHRRRQDLHGPTGCSELLQSWLKTAGEVVTWDQLAHGLRQVGRPDVARELGKNLNQDRSLELQRNVLEYGHTVRRLTSSLLLGGRRHQAMRSRRALAGDVGDLRFERRPPPPYTRSPLGWVGPIVSGILGGFFASVLCTVATVFSCRWVLG